MEQWRLVFSCIKCEKFTTCDFTHTGQDYTKHPSIIISLYPNAPIISYNERVRSVETFQIDQVTSFVTWVHENPTWFLEGGRCIYASNHGAEHRNQKVKWIFFMRKKLLLGKTQECK